MGIVIPPSIISHSKDRHQQQQEQLSSKVISSSSLMSQDYHHHQAAAAGIFSFSSNGFDRSEQPHHLTQQIRRDKLRVPYDPTVQQPPPTQPPGAGPGSLVGIEEEESGALPVYESAGMLSEMFNFPPGGPATAAELLDQNLQSNYRLSARQEQQHQQNNEWFNNRQGMVIGGLGPLTDSKNHHHHHQHNQISGINADSAAAMQLFLMNPQPRSPSPATAAPPPTATSNSTLHMLLPNPSTSLHHQGFSTSAGNFGDARNTSDHQIQSHHHHPQFTWVSDHHDGPNSNNSTAPSASVTQLNNPTHEIGSVVEGQGLSLSLSSSLQHLEAAKAEELRMGEGGLLYYNPNQTGAGSSSTSAAVAAQAQYLKNLTNQQQQQALHLQGIGVGSHHHSQVHVGYGSSSLGVVNVLRNSKYVKAAQELLEEFCSVGRGQFKKNKLTRQNTNPSSNTPGGGGSSIGGGGGGFSTTKDSPPLSAADRIEHQRRKVKLLSLLDEVDRRYNHYCEQMQMVVNSFDLVMGFGSAVPYTALAQKAMSRHFRCLKDAIAAQLKHSCELLGDKDGAGTSGLTKGETPRLKLLEQSLRQQRAFHQMGMMEQEAWRPQRGLPERSVNILRAWLFEHFLHPYPSDADKHLLARQTGLSRNQVSNWFINARVRLWKPMVEEMYQQESKDDEDEEKEIPKKQNNNSGQLDQTSTATPTTTNTTTTPTASSSPTTTTPTSTKRQVFNSENNTTNVTSTTTDIAPPPPPLLPAPPPPHGGGHFHELGDEYGTTDIGSTVIRFGTTGNAGAGGGDVSLTLGLRHAGNMPEKTTAFSVRDFGNC